jgi:hypothetical protein
MGRASYVCARCSQDFTRRWSGERHNRTMHFGRAEIVRLLDYVIGRISGKYTQADPLMYRAGHKVKGQEGSQNCFEPIEENRMRQEKGEGERTRRNEQGFFVPRTGFNRFKTKVKNDVWSYDLFGTAQSEDEANNKLIFKSSEITKEQKLDEIKTILAEVNPGASEWVTESMVRAVSLQNDRSIDDYWNWLRSLVRP